MRRTEEIISAHDRHAPIVAEIPIVRSFRAAWQYAGLKEFAIYGKYSPRLVESRRFISTDLEVHRKKLEINIAYVVQS